MYICYSLLVMSNYAIRGGLYQRHPFTTATVSFSEHLLQFLMDNTAIFLIEG
jgi:hypothetical protein